MDALRTELSSESNLFFHYSHDMDEKTFQGLQVRDLGDMVVKRGVKGGPKGWGFSIKPIVRCDTKNAVE